MKIYIKIFIFGLFVINVFSSNAIDHEVPAEVSIILNQIANNNGIMSSLELRMLKENTSILNATQCIEFLGDLPDSLLLFSDKDVFDNVRYLQNYIHVCNFVFDEVQPFVFMDTINSMILKNRDHDYLAISLVNVFLPKQKVFKNDELNIYIKEVFLHIDDSLYINYFAILPQYIGKERTIQIITDLRNNINDESRKDKLQEIYSKLVQERINNYTIINSDDN